jgi:hypothetical protein
VEGFQTVEIHSYDVVSVVQVAQMQNDEFIAFLILTSQMSSPENNVIRFGNET